MMLTSVGRTPRARAGRSLAACVAIALAGGALAGTAPAATPDTPFGAIAAQPPGGQSEWGYRMAAARHDFDGDGANDVFVSARGKGGLVYLMSGRDLAQPQRETRPLRIFKDPEGKVGRFGTWIFAVLGDVNDDDVPDIAVGDPIDDAVWVMSGKTAKVLHRLDNPSAFRSDRYSERVGRAGDITGDGASEVIVGAAGHDMPEGCSRTGVTPCSRSQGRAYVFSGATGALVRTLDLPGEDVPVVQLPHESAPTHGCRPSTLAGGCNFGNAVQGPGDVDNDGTPDQLVTANVLNDGQGRMYLFSGATGGLISKIDSPEPDLDTDGPTGREDDALADFGFQDAAPLSPGDVNHDGHADVYGASMDQDGPAGLSQGKAWVFSGKAIAEATSPVFSTPLYALEDPTPQRGNFGWSMDRTDYNRDGTPDLYIGQAQHHAGQGSGGTAVFDGTDRNPADSTESAAALKVFDMPSGCPEDGILGWSLAAPGDLNGDSEPDYVAGAPFMDVPLGQDPGINRGLVFGFASHPPASLPAPCSGLGAQG